MAPIIIQSLRIFMVTFAIGIAYPALHIESESGKEKKILHNKSDYKLLLDYNDSVVMLYAELRDCGVDDSRACVMRIHISLGREVLFDEWHTPDITHIYNSQHHQAST